MATNQQSDRLIWQRKLLRIYISGLAALAVLYLFWYVLKQFSPWFEQFENPFVAIVVSAAILIVLPPVLGLIIQYLVNPIFGRWTTWNELVRLEERLAGEIASDHEPKVVLVDLPDDRVKSIGVMTCVFPAQEGLAEMASVFVPYGTKARSGYIRIVPTDDLQIMAWTLRDFQLYQLTLGMVCPDQFFDESPG